MRVLAGHLAETTAHAKDTPREQNSKDRESDKQTPEVLATSNKWEIWTDRKKDKLVI